MDVVRAHLAAHLAHAPARLAVGQRDGARDRLAQPDHVVRVHEQRLAQLAGGAGELREHEHAAAAVAGGHVLLADQVHAVAQRGHEHHIGSRVQSAEVLAREVVVLVVDRRVPEAPELAVDAPDGALDALAQLAVGRHALAARRRDLHEHRLARAS